MTHHIFSKFKTPEGAHAFIQWKGTDVCADLHCACGLHAHVDNSFTYFARCSGCGRKYALEPYVRLVELNDAEQGAMTDSTTVVMRDEPAPWEADG